jgi:23S rRNA pseudouridine955/2504/2580 synthase
MSGVETVMVTERDGEQRLDRWLRRRFPGLTQGRIEKLLRTGQIRIDGRRAEAKTRVSAGQAVRLPPNLDAVTAAPTSRRDEVSERDARFVRGLVIHRDNDVLVLDKPAGLAVQGGTGQGRHLDGMLAALADDQGERPRLVHRLDRDTSGVLVLARHVRAAAALAAAFRSKDARKTYWALVVGVPRPERGRIDMALAKSAGPEGERVAEDDEDGKRAITLYAVADNMGDRAAWLVMRPITGRTHQLRVHAAVALGTPIVGDVKYGAERARLGILDVKPVLHLHARGLVMPHPAGGMLQVTAKLPPHMRETWSKLGFDSDIDADALFVSRRERRT